MASLRVRMATSYVLVTVAAVIVVEATMLTLLLSRTVGPSAEELVQRQANLAAKSISAAATQIYYGGKTATPQEALRAAAKAAAPDSGFFMDAKAREKRIDTAGEESAGPITALATLDGSIVMSSAPDLYRMGQRLPVGMPPNVTGASTRRLERNGLDLVWAVAPVILQTQLPDKLVVPSANPKTTVPPPVPSQDTAKSIPGKPVTVIGAVYMQVPKGQVAREELGAFQPLLAGGGVVMLLVVPVGVVFGLLSTRRLIRRVYRLGGMTASVAGGDFRSRVEVAGDDELGRLEDSVNRMAEQLGTALESERRLAGAGARQAERARIARELHDSISQDLFSLNLLAGGLRRALPEGDELRTQAAAMERTASRTMREMQALLLELRPVALEDTGLVPALEELCRAYETRLGIRVDAAIEEVLLDPPAEHAVLRVTQEALGNAIKHGDPSAIDVRLGAAPNDNGNGMGGTGDTYVALEVRDDGRGFEVARIGDRHGMGLGLMRERVTELGGGLEVISSPGAGTTVRVRLPARVSP
jgi:two-component system, NarL family, sensor histidine kinase LiaS